MDELIGHLSSINFTPHGHCYLWRADLVMLHAGSDLLIALAYYSIPLTLYFIWRRQKTFQFNWMFKFFAAFIFACGTTHLIAVWNIWHSDYYFSGTVKLLTGIISLATAILIWPALPKLLSLPNPTLLAERNRTLNQEIEKRLQVEQELRRLQESLEKKVTDRTEELLRYKQDLERQIKVSTFSQRRMQSIFESAPSGMIVVNVQGEILQANQQALNIFRFESAELIGSQIERLVPSDRQQTHALDRAQYVEKPVKRMMGERKNLFGLRRDNTRVPVEIGLNPVEGLAEKEIVATVVDITERREAERRIEERNAALERSNRELQEFAFIASHDLREPLRKIISFSRLLTSRDYGELTNEGTEYAGYVISAAERMRELLDSLLSYSRVASRPAEIVDVDLNQVVEEVRADLQLMIDESEAQILTNQLGVIPGDVSQIRQLLQNIVSNALKYQPGDRQPQIDIHGEIQGNNYYLRISDNGIGFEPQHTEKIFEVFKRLHGRDEFSGTGMGLAICRKIVERHQGSIRAEGLPGEGAVFHILLPRHQESACVEF